MATFVLVSGAWHAAWCWERVVPLLEARKHRVIAPDLLGMGPDRTPLSSITLQVWVHQITRLIREQPDPVVLVGHSRGGIIVSEVAEQAPWCIATSVYLTAFLVPSGQSLLSTALRWDHEQPSDLLTDLGDGTTALHPERARSHFYNMTEPDWAERATSLLTPEPMAVFSTPLELSDANFGKVRRVYIECTQDNAIPIELQRLMQVELPCDSVMCIETDHSPFYSAPHQLPECLDKVQ